MPTSTNPPQAAARPDTLPAALARLQTHLPRIGKDKTAKVKGKTKQGENFEYSYDYADLATITAAVMPLMGAVGLSFTATPTQRDNGVFVLAYELMHAGGDSVSGVYPLPSPADHTPQQVGSAITYARRYCLCAVTGVAADQDDDDARAAAETRTAEPQARGPAVRRRGRITRTFGDTGPDEFSSVDSNGERRPPGDLTGTYPPGQRQLKAMQTHFRRLGFTDADRAERLEITGIISGRGEITTSSVLEQDEVKAALKVLEKCRERAQLDAAVAALKESEDAGA